MALTTVEANNSVLFVTWCTCWAMAMSFSLFSAIPDPKPPSAYADRSMTGYPIVSAASHAASTCNESVRDALFLVHCFRKILSHWNINNDECARIKYRFDCDTWSQFLINFFQFVCKGLSVFRRHHRLYLSSQHFHTILLQNSLLIKLHSCSVKNDLQKYSTFIIANRFFIFI